MRKRFPAIKVSLLILFSVSWKAHAAGEIKLTGAVLERFHTAADFETNPYDRQVSRLVEKLRSASPYARAAAAEALGYLRAYPAAGALTRALRDASPLVRREAAMSLAWCGGRREVESLMAALEDEDWVARQAAWVALNNLTGMEWPFDALAAPDTRTAQVKVWRRWWATAPKDSPPPQILAMAAGPDLERRLRGARALGALGGMGATQAVLDVLAPYQRENYNKFEPLEKHLVQSCIRSLGRLRDPRALALLIDLLDNPGCARYAADALGDFGAREAIGLLIAAYPSFSRDLNNRTKNPKSCPADDRFSGDNTQDRMHETPYVIALALVRLPFDDPKDVAALRNIVPFLLANLPSNWDSGVLYEPESFERVTAYLLERAGLRRAALDTAFEAAARPESWLRQKADTFIEEGTPPEQCLPKLARKMYGDVPYMAEWLPALCRDKQDIPQLIALLDHESHWLRINAAKTLMYLNVRQAIEPIAKRLAESRPEMDYGFSGTLEHAEYNDPAPRWREAYIRALGRLSATEHDRLLVKILEDDRNVIEMHHAAAFALDELGTPAALEALQRAEANHPFHSVRMVAREALWRRGASTLTPATNPTPPKPTTAPIADARHEAKPLSPTAKLEAIVFIKGDNDNGSDFNGQAGVDPWRQTYSITNSGPTYRRGRNLYILRPARPDGKVTPLTRFDDGFVADCEVSWDGKRVIFARRLNGEDRNYREVPYKKAALKKSGEPLLGGPDDPWWHVWEINVDGTGLRQITHGSYHDVQPAYLPDGRIVFSSSRIGLRDEYHGYPCTGLTVMNADGTDIHPIGFNLGGDREPAVLDDGRIAFSRLDNFYSRLKTEMTVQTVFPDGTRNLALYGPERRPFWREVHKKNAAWTMRPSYGGSLDNRNRVMRLTQPQPFGRGRLVCASSGGLAIVGPGRYQERLVPHDRKWAATSPFPLDDRRILCAATVKQFEVDGRIVTAGTREFERLKKGPDLFRSAINIDLGLYIVDAETGEMTLLYNDPKTAEFEPRPIMPRRRPPVCAEAPRSRSYTANLFCNSARESRHERVRNRGKLVRVIEGMPIVARHETQQNRPTNRWKNHGGTHARILGIVPLAADGSFFIEVPADRLLHLQVLDSDRRVVGNQVFWMYARPGETRSCVGCHERRDRTMLPSHFAPAAKRVPVRTLPTGGEFSYRAKAWLKGIIPDECEERTRTVRAVSLLGRY